MEWFTRWDLWPIHSNNHTLISFPEYLNLEKMLLKMKGKDSGGGGDGGAAAAQNLLSDKPEGGILQGQYF